MPAKEKTTGSDRSNEHKKVTDETLHPLDPHNKERITQQKRAEEDIPEQTPIDEEELAGDEPLNEDL